MRTLIRLTIAFINLVIWSLVGVALCVVCSCQPVRYVPVETVKTDSVCVVDIQRDSIYILDSIYVREAHDTVYITKWRAEYKEALRVDTFLVERIDTLNTIVEVEKKLSKWQQTKMDIGAGVLYAVPILIMVGLFLLYRKIKK